MDKHELFLKVITHFIFKELTLKHSTDPSFYYQETLSLHEAIRLILNINPKFYKVPDYMHDKFYLIIKEIEKARICGRLKLSFEGSNLPKDLNCIFVDIDEFRTWLSSRKNFLPTKEIENFLEKTNISSTQSKRLTPDKSRDIEKVIKDIIALDNEERQTKENIRDDVILHFKESNKTVSSDLFQKAWKKAATPERMRAGRRKKDIKISKEK